MNYYEIGQRIRKFRKAYHLSQEQLAEKVGISTTHMSHIETGNTKLSLQVFVDIANALSVQTDELLYDIPQINRTVIKHELAEILDSCSQHDIYILVDVIRTLKSALDKYSNQEE
ncbi:MAG: helix-turn-helix domain-containing protein [Clostridium sp.]|nr:helix-turn-helix domain-containing protein [Clostridium sp.]